MTVDVLGTKYKIILDDFNCELLAGANRSGYCFFNAAEIHIEDLDTDDDWKNEDDAIKSDQQKKILRHEIIHAFLYESGLHANSCNVHAWAGNEEMVDWFALQMPKLIRAFEEAGCM